MIVIIQDISISYWISTVLHLHQGSNIVQDVDFTIFIVEYRFAI